MNRGAAPNPNPNLSPRKEMPTVDVLSASDSSNPTFPYTNSFLLPIPLSSCVDPLLIKSTYPRVVFALAFLVSSIVRRDVVGQKPWRAVFAIEGLRAGAETGVEVACESKRCLWTLNLTGVVPVWATLEDVRDQTVNGGH
ncbi:hypothetical protein CTheo_7598 [Ceratobasidium theobromae]|uniref:Uncharacterized protein n=1 Tax=Ceratobasidium theobromae TaxID=1582974 RepID=A0A5N5QBC6_9AGAM|nr:hypothetical protein CTheo_7598 [Ceratobasidium theobromae]